MEGVLEKYNVKYKVSTPYHPQTCGQAEVSNRLLKQILEKTVSTSHRDQAKQFGETLWEYMTQFKIHIVLYPYQFVYRKYFHLPAELEHKAYWAIKFLNFDDKIDGRKILLKLDDLEEMQLMDYDNNVIYKDRNKMYHDKNQVGREFKIGKKVLLYNSRLSLCSGKLKSRWFGLFIINKVFANGDVKVHDPRKSQTFTMNNQRLKIYKEGEI